MWAVSMPLLIYLTYVFLFWYFDYGGSTLGFKTRLTSCNVMARDEIGQLVPTNETVEIHQVNYGVKFVEATTFEGSMYGLGFIHAKDRLW